MGALSDDIGAEKPEFNAGVLSRMKRGNAFGAAVEILYTGRMDPG